MVDPIENPLAQAERHVREAEKHVAHQEGLVAELARDGHDTALAESLLKTMKNSLRLALAHLDQERQTAQRGKRVTGRD